MILKDVKFIKGTQEESFIKHTENNLVCGPADHDGISFWRKRLEYLDKDYEIIKAGKENNRKWYIFSTGGM